MMHQNKSPGTEARRQRWRGSGASRSGNNACGWDVGGGWVGGAGVGENDGSWGSGEGEEVEKVEIG